tara:strand:- start:524 stop:961 length:438 start_codon:yes stop_codon:yes gene_type:complete
MKTFKQFITEGIDTNGDNLYHVTLSRYVPKIRKLGLVPMGSDSNWTTGDGKRYGNGEVYAFQTLKDAVNWASDWDWSLTSSWGSGKISIVVFKRDSEEWESDDNDTLSQSGKQKPWLKRMNTVNPSEIVDVIPLSQDLVVDTLRG